MFQKTVSVISMLYFSIGSIVLPMGNFALLPQLPHMYEHCKTHEHHDMNAWEFVTDHLVNVDGIFDEHGEGDEQKPHTPLLNDSFFQQESFYGSKIEISINPNCIEKEVWLLCLNNYVSEYSAFVFRPPIVC